MSTIISEDYLAMMREIEEVCGSETPGIDLWASMNGVDVASYYATEYEAVSSMPSAVITKNRAGDVIGTDLIMQAPREFNPPAVVNSNVPNPIYSGSGGDYGGTGYRINGSGGGTSPNVFSSGAKKTGTGTKVITGAGTVLSTVCWASLGAQLGKAINANFGGQYAWTEQDWYNWTDSMDSLDKAVFRTLFGIDNGAVTAYMPEEMLALEYLELLKMGAFDAGFEVLTDDIPVITGDSVTRFNQLIETGDPTVFTSDIPFVYIDGSSFSSVKGTYATQVQSTRKVKWFNIRPDNASGTGSIAPPIAISFDGPFTLTTKTTNNGSPVSWASGTSQSAQTTAIIDGVSTTIWYATANNQGFGVSSMALPQTGNFTSQAGVSIAFAVQQIATILRRGTFAKEGGVEGITDDPRATTQVDPDVITGTTPETVLPQLKQNYPQLFGDSIYEDVPQEDGSTRRITYIPVPWPTKDVDGNPITGTPSQTDPQVDPDTATDDEIKDLIDTLTDFFTNPPTTGTGGSPSVVVPAGSASSLWKIYNPTQAQVDAFGAWLWSSNFVEQIKKLFNDPMQAIIGIHKVFATPSIGGTATIKVGYLDSGVSSDYIDDQYTTIDCGTVNLRECFGNVFDYAPYTRVSLYLPFIGIVDLDVADVMRASINIVYHVDVLTGACLADVKVIRDACGGVLYQYSGSAIVTYPVSSGNYMGMVAGVLSVASGIAGTVLSGGALAPALIGGAVGASHLHTDVSHSGGFSGCAGAMGGKIPYIIVSRPQPALAGNFEHFTGLPANAHVTLANCSGMTRVKSVYVKSIHRATDEEKDMIENQLKAGVLV